MMRPTWMAALSLVCVFALGSGVGMLSANYFAARAVKTAAQRPPDHLEERSLHETLKRRIELNDAQLQTLDELLARDRGAIIAVRRHSIEQLLKIREREKDELLPTLSPLQQTKLQRLYFEHQQRQLELIEELSALESRRSP